MKFRSTLVATGALMGLLLVPAPAMTQTTVELEVTPFAGGTFFLSDLPTSYTIPVRGHNGFVMNNGSYDDAFTVGTNVGVRIADRFGIEGFFAWTPTDLNARFQVPINVHNYMYGLTGLYHFNTNYVRPFLGLGVGAETMRYDVANWEGGTDFMTNLVAGANIPFNDVMALRLEARDCISWFDRPGRSDKIQNGLMLSAGVSFRAPLTGS